jgi:hypothetical protein
MQFLIKTAAEYSTAQDFFFNESNQGIYTRAREHGSFLSLMAGGQEVDSIR